MQLWNLKTPHTGDRKGPQVLFSTPEARGVVIDLEASEELGDHRVRERAVVQVLSGGVELTAGEDTAVCEAGALVLLEPGERHAVRAVEASRLLLTLAPWPAPDHYGAAEGEDPHELPANATVSEGL